MRDTSTIPGKISPLNFIVKNLLVKQIILARAIFFEMTVPCLLPFIFFIYKYKEKYLYQTLSAGILGMITIR